MLDFKIIDSGANEVKPEQLRHLALSGRYGYSQQGVYGENVIAAVVDTGVAQNHPELDGRVVEWLNFSGYGQGYDDNGHGTHVAGTIAGTNVGIANKGKILSVKVLDGTGGGNFNNIIKALETLVSWRSRDGKKVTLASMSLSAPASLFNSEQLTRFHNAIKTLVANGIAVICSAGNTGSQEIRYPAYFAEPITVSAVDPENLSPASFTTLSNEVDVAQCGIDIASAWFQGGYAIMSGTSMSTPIVSGIALLIADKFYQLFKQPIPEQVLYWMLKMNTKDLLVKGVDVVTGAGFCSLQPVSLDLYTKQGNMHWTLNKENAPLIAPIVVIPPGVTSLPARKFIEEGMGGIVSWNPETLFARFRL